MSSLQEELARLGLAKPRSEKSGKRRKRRRPEAKKNRGSEDPGGSLAAAYRARAQAEKDEKAAAEQAARERRARNAEVKKFIRRSAINHEQGEIARNFQHGERIRRIYVDETQLRGINSGDLAIVHARGRYHLLRAAAVEQLVALDPDIFVFRQDPEEPGDNDGVPDDLIW